MPKIGTEAAVLDRGSVVIKGQVRVFGNANEAVIALGSIEYDLGSTNINNFDPGDVMAGVWLMTATAALEIRGIENLEGDDRQAYLYNEGTEIITLVHDSVSATAGNELRCPEDANLELLPGTAVLAFKRNPTDPWRILELPGSGGSFGDIDEDRILGRAIGAGTGPVQQLTPLQAATIVAAEVSDLIESTSLINVSGVLQRAALTGDVTAAQNSNSLTIANNAVTNAKAADMAEARIKGRAAGVGTGDPQDLTGASAANIIAPEMVSTSIVNVVQTLQRAALVGDVTAPQNSNTTTIEPNVVTNPKLADVPNFSFKGRNAGGTGDPQDLLTGDIVSMFDSTSIIGNTGTGRYERAALTGDVTATQNSNATTIANNAVTNVKAADMVQATIKGRASGAGTGDPTDLTGAQVATIVAPSLASTSVVASGSTLQRAALTGDVTAAQNSNSLTIANNAVTNPKAADMATQTLKGRSTAGTGDPEDLSGQLAGAVIANNATSLTWAGDMTFNSNTNVNSVFKLTSIQTVATGSNINNLSIGGSNVIKVQATTRLDFTGMAGGVNGRWVVIINDDSSNTVVIRRADSGSSNGNQFVTSGNIGDIVLRSRDCAICLYISPIGDNANGFWYIIASTGVIHANGVLSQSTAVSVDSVDVRDVDIYRITPTAGGQFIQGLVPREDENHRVFIFNASTTQTIAIADESSSTATHRFALGTTSVVLLPERGVQAWYDPTSNRWRVISQYASTGL